MASSADRAVVVGAGHNGLVAACYLAKAGLDVEVVERDTVVGGAVSTVERFPGYRMDRGSSAHIMVRHTGIIEDLDLVSAGLEYQDLDPWGFAPFGDQAVVPGADHDRPVRAARHRDQPRCGAAPAACRARRTLSGPRGTPALGAGPASRRAGRSGGPGCPGPAW